jgi:hypothetical protein
MALASSMVADVMALPNPRQALPMSKLRHDDGRPSWWCTAQATDGSRFSLHTEVEIRMPICDGSMPAFSMAARPAMAAASANETSSSHQRRSSMPARPDSRPGRNPLRS